MSAGPARNDKDARKANKRGAARLAAVQALYQMDLAGTGLNEILAEFESHARQRFEYFVGVDHVAVASRRPPDDVVAVRGGAPDDVVAVGCGAPRDVVAV